MSVRRSRTSTHRNEKVRLVFDYGLDELTIRTEYNTVYVRYDKLNGYEASSELLKLFYRLIDMDFIQIEETLNVKISGEGIRDKKGNKITIISL